MRTKQERQKAKKNRELARAFDAYGRALAPAPKTVVVRQGNTTNGIGLGAALFLIFLILKLTHNINWSWWWVFSPFWIPLAGLVAIGLIVLFVVAVTRNK